MKLIRKEELSIFFIAKVASVGIFGLSLMICRASLMISGDLVDGQLPGAVGATFCNGLVEETFGGRCGYMGQYTVAAG